MTDRSKIPFDRDEQMKRLADMARAENSTPEELLRKALDSYESGRNGNSNIASKPSPTTLLDRWQKLGVIGCVPENAALPCDLSTNPAYLDGLGRA